MVSQDIDSFPLFFWKADFILYCVSICLTPRLCYILLVISSFLISSSGNILLCFSLSARLLNGFCFDSCFCTFPYKIQDWCGFRFSELPALHFSFHFDFLQCILHFFKQYFHSTTHKIPFKDTLCLALAFLFNSI